MTEPNQSPDDREIDDDGREWVYIPFRLSPAEELEFYE